MLLFVCNFCGREYEVRYISSLYGQMFRYKYKDDDKNVPTNEEDPCAACEEKLDSVRKDALKMISDRKEDRSKKKYGDGKYGK